MSEFRFTLCSRVICLLGLLFSWLGQSRSYCFATLRYLWVILCIKSGTGSERMGMDKKVKHRDVFWVWNTSLLSTPVIISTYGLKRTLRRFSPSRGHQADGGCRSIVCPEECSACCFRRSFAPVALLFLLPRYHKRDAYRYKCFHMWPHIYLILELLHVVISHGRDRSTYQWRVQRRYSLIAVKAFHTSFRFISSCKAMRSRAHRPSKYLHMTCQLFASFSSLKRRAMADR